MEDKTDPEKEENTRITFFWKLDYEEKDQGNCRQQTGKQDYRQGLVLLDFSF